MDIQSIGRRFHAGVAPKIFQTVEELFRSSSYPRKFKIE
jgi:hypothetical protein